MSDALFQLVPEYGAGLVFLATFLSCLALPAPSSLIMLAAGAFVASGDFSGWSVVTAAFGGAVLGDQLGYWIGRKGGMPLWDAAARRPKTAGVMARAQASLHRQDILAVYFSRWLFSPLGPYVNLAGGATRMNWVRFTIADLAGEATWVGAYTGLGYGFASQIEELGDTLGNIVGALAAGLVTLLLGRALLRASREAHARKP